MVVEGKSILVTGGTGSLGQRVVSRLLSGELGMPERVFVFSRDEAKQHAMRLAYLRRPAETDDAIFRASRDLDILRFVIGDVRDSDAVRRIVGQVQVVIHAAALKQVPTAEYFPAEAVATNVTGTLNLIKAIETVNSVEAVVGISTDKACKPVNVMGMSKALMERILIESNLHVSARVMCVRYGNVIASRGSVVPLMLDQISKGGPVTLTSSAMTRFLLGLDEAVDTVFAALRGGGAGEIYVPKLPAVRIHDLARALIADQNVEIEVIGVRPGEKLHEVLISEEEVHRTIERDGYYVVTPMLPELATSQTNGHPPLDREFSSKSVTMTLEKAKALVGEMGLMSLKTSAVI